MTSKDLGWVGAITAVALLLSTWAAPGPITAIATGFVAWLALRQSRAMTNDSRSVPIADLQAALRRRDDQLAHTAHELRTPLASVVMALEMLREGYATAPDEVEEYLDQASLAARHLGFLVNDVLDEAALAAGQLRLHRQEHFVADLLRGARDVIGLQARLRGIDLHFDAVPAELAIRTDERRFLQIMFNLIGNALKFTAKGEQVLVRVESRGDQVRFMIEDHGSGVPMEARPRLFCPFGSAPSAPGQAVPGTGLGLHVCRLLVEQLGGSIAYEPGQPRGSVFWFEQPAARAEAAGQDSAVASVAVAT